MPFQRSHREEASLRRRVAVGPDAPGRGFASHPSSHRCRGARGLHRRRGRLAGSAAMRTQGLSPDEEGAETERLGA